MPNSLRREREAGGWNARALADEDVEAPSGSVPSARSAAAAIMSEVAADDDGPEALLENKQGDAATARLLQLSLEVDEDED